MKKLVIGRTKNNKTVYVDKEGSHAATHLADTPQLFELVKHVIADLSPSEDNVYIDKDMGRSVGMSDLVETTASDEIIYAKRLNRDNYTRFVLNRLPELTSFVTVALQKDAEGDYGLWTAWIGRAVPQFPGDSFETPDSRIFWQKHALVWGSQATQPNTERKDWPWS